MPKDRSERKAYRKSPGRQYGYDYDPLRSRSGQSQSGRIELSGDGNGRSGTQLAQRPNPRRTRQLLRQSIIANRGRYPGTDHEQAPEQQMEPQEGYDEQVSRRHTPTRNRPSSSQRPYIPSTQELMGAGEEREENWQELVDVDPDVGYDEPLDVRMRGYAETPSQRAPVPPTSNRNGVQRAPGRTARPLPAHYEEYDDDNYEDEEDEDDQPQRPRKKKNLSRRGLLFGLGAVAVGGAGVAAYELGPKLPQAVGNVGANIEHQLQDAFNKGVQQGADSVRKEFVTTLDSLEGFSLDGAMQAAKLTRVAYDTFVSPLVTAGATITGDFLNGMLQALRSARGFLAQGGQDNATLAAVQKVLETWVAQVSNMPKQLNTITQTDLDGAQGYLRELKRKLDAEKALLNSSPKSPTATPAPKPTAKPK